MAQLPRPEVAWREAVAWRQAVVRQVVAHQAAAHIARRGAADPQVRAAADNREAGVGACSLRQAEEVVVVPLRTTT